MTHVLVLGGGPDAEREVSLASSSAVAIALRESGHTVTYETLDSFEQVLINSLPGDVIFPVVHGPLGEGGPLQDILKQDGRPYVSSTPGPARLAMDKLATKLIAERLGIPTPPAAVLNLADTRCPLDFPIVIKPVHEGSTIGFHLCADARAFEAVIRELRAEREDVPDRVYMVERAIPGRELTVGLLDAEPLPIIEIIPAEGRYDYEAKYQRDDTRYLLDPDLPDGLDAQLKRDSVRLHEALGLRHMARADFMLEVQPDGLTKPWLLEINTIPGFTSHSLLPMAARHAGIPMPQLCARLVACALRDYGQQPSAADPSKEHHPPATVVVKSVASRKESPHGT